MRPFGIHLRIEDAYSPLLAIAKKIDATACQFFFVPQGKKKQCKVTPQDLKKFVELKNELLLFGHSTYLINPATKDPKNKKIALATLKKEVSIAKKLGIPYLVLHGGSAKEYDDRRDGIKALAEMLHKASDDAVTFLVENTTHGGMSICSDLEDFILLRQLVPHVRFCCDTAHAFAYGYNLEEPEALVELLDQTMGTENIVLLHLNDSVQICGSKIDQHEVPGVGLIGKERLLQLATHKKLQHTAIIVEPPPGDLQAMKKIMELREYL